MTGDVKDGGLPPPQSPTQSPESAAGAHSSRIPAPRISPPRARQPAAGPGPGDFPARRGVMGHSGASNSAHSATGMTEGSHRGGTRPRPRAGWSQWAMISARVRGPSPPACRAGRRRGFGERVRDQVGAAGISPSRPVAPIDDSGDLVRPPAGKGEGDDGRCRARGPSVTGAGVRIVGVRRPSARPPSVRDAPSADTSAAPPAGRSASGAGTRVATPSRHPDAGHPDGGGPVAPGPPMADSLGIASVPGAGRSMARG